MKRQDEFLRNLISAAKVLTKDKQLYHIKGPDEPIEWFGQPRSLWPKADMMVKLVRHQIIVETDEDSDPCRSLVKYWPYLETTFQNMPCEKVTVIGIWKRGSTIGQGYFELAKFVGRRFEEIFPAFSYIPKERVDESVAETARWLVETFSRIAKETGEVSSN